jgi:hypothetical protein
MRRHRQDGCHPEHPSAAIVRPFRPLEPIALQAGHFPATDAAQEFSQSILPVLAQNRSACHSPENPKNRVNFLSAKGAKDMEKKRELARRECAGSLFAIRRVASRCLLIGFTNALENAFRKFMPGLHADVP